MLSLGSPLRHLECVAWKPGELWETPWLRGHISGTLLNSTSNPCKQGQRGRKRSATASRSALPEHGFLVQDAAEAERNNLDSKELQKVQEINELPRKVMWGTYFDSEYQAEISPQQALNCLFSLLPTSWKH